MRLAPLLISLFGLWLSGCEDRQCEVLSDCAPSEICLDGLCEASIGGQLRDAGARADSGAHPDASAAGDAGADPDGGGRDAGGPGGDAGAPGPDAGPGSDAGVGALPSTGDLGFVWTAELLDGESSSAFHAFALLQRLDAAAFSTRTASYADGEGTSCLVSIRRLVGGAVTGFEAEEISVIPGPQPFSSFSMYPVGNGRFEPIQDPVQRIYNKSRFAAFQIFGTSNAGSVESSLVQVSAPAFVFEDSAYPRGTPIDIAASPQLLWRPSDLSDGRITVEVFDAPREVVLTCAIADDGSYVIPPDAISDLLNAQPLPPVFLEIRYDEETTASASIQGGGELSVTYRASQGLRYPVTLP